MIRICSSFNVLVSFVYFAELFPTYVRSIGLGVIFSASQLGKHAQTPLDSPKIFLLSWLWPLFHYSHETKVF